MSQTIAEQNSLASDFKRQKSFKKTLPVAKKEDLKSKIVEFVRRKSCICTHCVGIIKKQRLGDQIVLDHEKEMIIKF